MRFPGSKQDKSDNVNKLLQISMQLLITIIAFKKRQSKNNSKQVQALKVNYLQVLKNQTTFQQMFQQAL